MPSWAANIIHEFYVPLPEVQVKTALVGIEPASGIVGNTLESVVSIVATGAGTVIHFDHWEDGYEVDLNNPAQATTQIWGDGNDANGIPPGYVNDPATFATGSVIVLRNQVPLPRNPANRLYDGRDRFGGTKALVVSRASWATTPGTVLCGANEVLPTMDYGTQYIAPVGDDVSSSAMFEYAGLFVMARDDATTVAIDADGSGAGAAINITLNRGESYVVNGGIKKGATVNAGKPVQVHLVTGDIGARYESRRFTLYPRDQWSDVTYSPVGTAANGHQAYAFIYNPNASALTINVTTAVGTASFSVAANGVTQYQIPQSSGARFVSSNGADFFGIVTVGANPSSNNVHDWGFSMVPSDNLTTEAVVGWGPGSENLTQNGSPVWVTPTSATRVYVDYNGDRAGSLTDPKGGKYDAHLDVGTMESRRVNDPDKDQTAMRLYTLDGVTITAAWGQDPAIAGPALPYLDCGTTVLPFPVPTLIKSFTIAIDAGNPGLTIGDTIEYRIDVDNKGLLPLGNLLVLDPLNVSLGYVTGSTKRDGVAIADAVTGTAFPLDESGYVIPIILRGGMTTFTYRCTVNAAGSIANTVSNTNYNLVSTANVVVPPPAGSTNCAAQFTNSSGTVQTSYTAGALIYGTMTDPDANNTASVESITVVVRNTTNGDAEFVTLVETTATSGIFRNTTGLTTSTTAGSSQMDGTLLVAPGNSLSFVYTDPEFNETCTGNAVIAVPTQNKFLYLSDPGQALDRVDPVATSDTTTANTAVLTMNTSSIAVDNVSNGSATNPSTVTFSHTTGSGANRLMLVGISYEDDNTANLAVTGVTYAGQALTFVGRQVSPQEVACEIWRLVNPPSGVANVVVSVSGSDSTDSLHAGAITYTGVHQTTPLGTLGTGSASSAAASATVASAANELVFGVLALDDGRTATNGASQTERWNARTESGDDGVRAAAATKTGAASTTLNWTVATDSWSVCAVPLKPAQVPATVTFIQAPAFASTFTLPVGAAPTVTAYYNVSSGTMPASPGITAVLKRNTTTIATSTSASASTSTGNGLLTLNFGALASTTNFAATDYVTLDITTAQAGVSFTVQFDSSTRASKITLPTTTVIDVNTLGVYDAPYPAGNLITGLTSGTTAYVRSTVSDPFGHADITSMGLAITGPGGSGNVSTTLNGANVVNTTTGTKTYEYAWAVGATTGTYNIAVTANEGTEGITATRATTVNVTMLDLGTPSTTEFTTGVNGPGTPTYAGGETVCVRVTDLDQNTNATVAETVTVTITTASGDSELVTLTETGVNTGIFAGSIPASTTLGAGTNNGTLRAVLGELLTATYVDPTDSLDTSNDTATIPNASPAVSVKKTLVLPADGIAVIGEALQYTVQVANTGNTTLSTIALTDTFPAANLTFVSASLTPSSTGSGTVSWTNVGPLASGQSITLTLNFTALTAGATVTNTAAANAGGGVTGSSFANVAITRPAHTITKTLISPTPGPANIGAPVVFRISVTNTGTTAIATLPVEDLFSGADFTFVSATTPPDATGNGTLLWNDITGAGSLAAGATATAIDVTLTAKGAAAPATNSASANYSVDANGDPVPAVSSSATITLVAAKITGRVYIDPDQTGTVTAGDTGFSGVTVTLYNSLNNVVAIATTATDGLYEFPNLATGTYTIVESQPAGYSSSGDTQGANDNRITVNVSTLTTFANNNFFDYLTAAVSYASISGKVWNDANASAAVTAGEVGIENVQVDLIEDANGNGVVDPGEAVVGSTLTAADGTYTFAGLSAGNYVVVERDLFGWYSTADAAAPNNNMIPVSAAAGSSTTGRDFLDVLTGTVGGKVFHDVDGSGTFNAGDVALQNIDVIITDVFGVLQTVVTNATGDWTASVPPGTTSVNVDQADAQFTAIFTTGYQQTAGTDPNNVTAVSSVSTSAGDDGFRGLGSITGTVLADTNNDDSGDVGINGVTLTLKDSSGNDVDNNPGLAGVQPTTTTTNASGVYTFTGVPHGTYRVVETDLPGYFSVTTNTVNPVNVVAGSTTSGVNFVDEQAGTITGFVRADTDNNDTGDVGINAVTLTLKDGSGNDIDSDEVTSGMQATVTTTNASGVYTFSNVRPGTYRVVETDLAGYFSITNNTVTPVVVNAGLITSNVNFVDEQAGSITGTVRADTDNNDTGDVALSGVTLTLQDSSGNNIDSDAVTTGIQPTSTTTNASGAYSFINLLPGSYRVVETDLPGYFSVTPNTANPVNVVAGTETANVNFVDEQAGSITGFVRADTDNNDSGDVPLNGVTLTLKDSSGNDIDSDLVTPGVQATTTTTNASGVYTFSNLVPGTYRVVETDLAGYLSITPNTVSPVEVSADTVTSNVNFVDEQNGSIIGTVLADIDNDDMGDDPISGVTITLKDSSGNDIDSDPVTSGVQVTTATTNASGAYTFADLPPGSYRVVETDLAGYFSVTPNTLAPVLVVAGTPTADVNFVDEEAGSISGTVLADTDNDDDGDVPVDGVTLTLKDLNGDDIDSDPVTAGVQATTTTTNASGAYIFSNVTPGSYLVVETDLPGYVSVTSNTVGPATVVAGANTTGADFVDEQTASIKGSVLADIDNDDMGDDPISGVTITLKDSNGNDVDSDPVTAGVQPTTTTTNASGAYGFTNLTPGTYRVVETDPAGYFSVTPNTLAPVAVLAGTPTNDVNFVDEEAGSITGTVLADTDNDDDGDSPIDGVTLTLKDSNGDDIDSDDVTTGVQPTTTTTNASGLYTFSGLAPGTYRVVETDLTGYFSVTPNTVTPVLVAAGAATPDVNFVDEEAGSITGTVLADIDNDDMGDGPLSGITLTLKDSNGDDIDSDDVTTGVQPTTTNTNAGGAYSFTGLVPGTYRVMETDPAGYFSVTPNAISPVDVVAGMVTSDVNFVDEEAGSISGTVLADADNDDMGDDPLSGVTLTLRDGSDNDIDSDEVTPGVQPTTTTTSGTGAYSFTGLRPGAYRVIQTDLPGYFSVTANTVSPVVVTAGSANQGVDFVDEQAGSISGSVLADIDNDDDGDTPIEGVVLTLKDSNGDEIDSNDFVLGVQPTTTTTDASGAYSFTGLRPGSYRVEETDPADYFSVSPNTVMNVNVVAGAETSDVDFIDEQPGSISGSVLADTDNDDDGDVPISGVTITLKDSSGNDVDSDNVTSGVQPTTTTTNASGAYSFTGLLPGIYRVLETDPLDHFSVTPNTVSPVLVVAGTTTEDVDFVDEQPGSISGSVLADNDNDDDGDAPLSGVTITLQDSNGNDIDSDDVTGGVQPTTTTTNAGGAYTFSNLLPGIYRVVETDPAGYLSVTPNTVSPVNVAAGTPTADINFVDEEPGSISGTVLADIDNDDDGDTPLSGVTITLKDSNGNDIDSDDVTSGVQPTTTTTNAGGAYTFSNLLPGTYRVVETDPAGYLSVTTNTLSPVNVIAGIPVTDANFIDEQSVTIGNLVWNDSDNDGIKDAGESGIDAVVVELLTSTGASIDGDALTAGIQPTTSTTAAGGLYSFTNVAPGLYRLRIATPPAGFPLSSPTTNTSDDQQDDDDNGIQATVSAATLSPVIELAAGEVDDTIDFGFAALAGMRTISGQVRDDYDLDGSLSDSDQPVPSVNIRLFADTNDNGVYDDGIDQLIRETKTDALGTYTFTGLPSGTYFVQEIDPEGSTSTTDTEGSNDNLILVVLNGTDRLGNDFLDAVDPAGYAYDVVTGQIITGGSIFVSGPPGAGITILQDGSTGQYSFITDGTPGTYTFSYTPPTGYIIDPARPPAGASYDPTGQPDPHALGSGEDTMNPGYLTNFSAAANPYYFSFVLESGDPFVINNNIPLRLRTPRKYDYWKKITGSGPNPGSNGDGDCYSDLVEYGLNLDPDTGVQISPAFRGVRNTLTGRLDVSFNRISSGPDDVTYALMGIGALANSPAGWNALSIIPTVTDNGDGTETLTYADVESDPFFTGQTQGFVRLYLELDENGDNIPEANASTPVFGWTRRLLNTECVMTGHPYLKDKNFCGTIDAVVGSTLNVATSAGGSSIVAQFAPGREYFVEIFSGDNAGHRFEINEATSTDTTIALVPSHLRNTQTSIPANLTGDKAVIREHHTLNDLFPRTQFTATNDPSTGDRVLFYDRVAGAFKIYWLYTNGGNPKWLLTNDATLTDYSSLIVDPSEGWFTHPKGVPQEVVWHGMVRANPFACPLAQGPNFIGSGYPMDQSPAMRGMTTAAGFIGSRDPTKADELLFWKGYTSTQSMAYYNHFLLSAGALQQWTELNNASLINENNLLIFKATAGALYKMRTGLPTYVMPMPWTP